MQKFNKNLIIATFAVSVLIGLILFAIFRDRSENISYSKYEELLKSNSIEKIYIDERVLTLKTLEGDFQIPKEGIDLKELFRVAPVDIDNSKELTSNLIDIIILSILLFFVIALLKTLKREREFEVEKKKRESELKKSLNSINRKAQFAQEDSSSSDIKASISSVTFKDVAGIKEVKEELEEIIDFLKNPKKYVDFGIKLPKGVLLVGPPGVGKTLIAKAVAGEANVPFFYQSGSSFVQIYVGVGAKRVRELFNRAKLSSPAIIFIDEIDAVGKSRGANRNDERESTLNQLLTEMDGFEESRGIIVIGATNKIEMLDEALLRAGRFDRRVFVSLPNFKERVDILRVNLENKKHNIDIEEIAKLCVGFNGASISSFVNEAAIDALKKSQDEIEMSNFLAVKNKVLFGKKRQASFSEEEKRILATYQGAKALSAYWLEIEFEKISLISDNFKEFDRELVSKSELLNKIKVYLSGAFALELIYSETYSNSSEDLAKAKLIATDMVESYGMGTHILSTQVEVGKILDIASKEIKEFLSGSKSTLDKIQTHLLEQESITKEELKELIDSIF